MQRLFRCFFAVGGFLLGVYVVPQEAEKLSRNQSEVQNRFPEHSQPRWKPLASAEPEWLAFLLRNRRKLLASVLEPKIYNSTLARFGWLWRYAMKESHLFWPFTALICIFSAALVASKWLWSWGSPVSLRKCFFGMEIASFFNVLMSSNNGRNLGRGERHSKKLKTFL